MRSNLLRLMLGLVEKWIYPFFPVFLKAGNQPGFFLIGILIHILKYFPYLLEASNVALNYVPVV
jgi:uncharacterized membrane protein YqaE (UPF0057 family)